MAPSRKVCPSCSATYPEEVLFCPQDGAPLTARKTEFTEDPYVGLVVAEQFELKQLVGIGSMGRVYRAWQAGIERDVAVKVLHRELMRNEPLVGRFHRESKVAGRLVHPNVVHVLMTGQLAPGGDRTDGEAFLVMEYLDGISLRSALAAGGGAMPLPRALHIILQVCDAVGEAHAQSIVHRDLKPENIMLVRRGDDPDFVKLLDFGVARAEWAESSTQAGAIFGTARYISPEGAQGERVGAPADVYSIATMLFQCLSGQTPFEGDNPVTILLKHTQEPAPDIRTIARASYVPEPLANVIRSNLSKSPTERCRDARELGRAIVQAAQQSGLSVDDLVLRATLLGGAGRALGLRSIEATRSLTLTAELAARMGGGATAARPGGTEISDDAGEEPERPPVTRTIADDSPVGQPARSAAPANEPEHSPSLTASTVPNLASFPPPLPPSSFAAVPRSHRIQLFVLVAAAFLLVAVVIIAARLARDDEPGVAEYVGQAEEALANERWDAPPGQNVKELTDAALQRWPNHADIVRVRKKAADALATIGERLAAAQPAESERRARLALDLDPSNAHARKVVDSLQSEPEPGDDDAVAPPTDRVESHAASQRRAPAPPRPAERSAAAPPRTAAGDAGAARAPAPPVRGDPWL